MINTRANFFLDIDKSQPLQSLNDRNDLTRMAYQDKSNDIPLNNGSTERFETDTFINHTESFEKNNSRINSLNEEVRELKVRQGELQEKEDTIRSLKESLQTMKAENSELMMRNRDFASENRSLKDVIGNLERQAERDKNSGKVSDDKVSDDKVSDDSEGSDKIAVDITRLKSILCSRLKTYHEKHIDDLIDQYDLTEKKEIDKSMMEEILFEAIHF